MGLVREQTDSTIIDIILGRSLFSKFDKSDKSNDENGFEDLD